MKRFVGWLSVIVMLAACHRPAITVETGLALAPPQQTELSSIDSLMWTRPDSALACLVPWFDSTMTVSDRHYAHLLLAELLYKNDYGQANRAELLEAVAYFDSLGDAFLAARAHYINGVGYHELDSVVPACEEYLKALEVMEEHFPEKELVGKKAKFMALVYTHLCELFSDQYLNEQAVYFGKQSLLYYDRYNAEPWHVAWVLDEIGMHYDMMDCYDSAEYYYHKALAVLPDTNNLMSRITFGHLAFLEYSKYKDEKKALAQLNRLCELAENEDELLSGYLSIGEIYYEEKLYDSAWGFLAKVYEESSSIDSKKQAAEWLINICKVKGEEEKIIEYTIFLAPFANQNENKSSLKSRLCKLHSTYIRQKMDKSHLRETLLHTRKTLMLVVGLLVVIIIISLLFFKSKRKKNRLEAQIVERQQAFETEQKNLERLLKQSNDLVCELEDQVRQQDAKTIVNSSDQITSFFEEPICQHILRICNDAKNPIKSTIPIKAYAEIALSHQQRAQLYDAVARHYDWLFEKLKKEYSGLKEKDLTYCYLCLLGLNNIQIAALLQKTNSTIWDRERHLRDLFGREENIGVVLHGFLEKYQKNKKTCIKVKSKLIY